MITKRLSHLLIPILLFALLAPASIVKAGTQNITTTADVTLVNGLCSLREAITAANAGAPTADCPNISAAPNTLLLASGAVYTLAGSLSTITTSALTIEPVSGTATVEANAAPNTANYRVFTFNSTGTLTLNNLTLRNGGNDSTFTVTGGCVSLLTNGTLIISSVTVTGCYGAGNGGGAIGASSGGTIQITSSTFTSNVANGTSGGGAIYMNGNINAASLTISGGTTFTSNTMNSTSSGQAGGAISCILCSVSITGGSFSGNSANSTGGAAGGGALYFNATQTVTISGVTFTNNTAAGTSTTDGGAISVSTQRAITLNISDSVFSGNGVNGGTASGGAISFGNGTLSISNTRIQGNTATGNGDAIY